MCNATTPTPLSDPTTPTVRIIEVRFLESDVFEGTLHRCHYENARIEDFECDAPDEVDEAVRALERAGVSFAATGNEWAADPDGSYISNYATGERVETSGHLYGFSEAQANTIMERVG